MATGPGTPRDGSQQSGAAAVVVGAIVGFAHQVAVRRGVPPRRADTICQGGTCSFEGLAISSTPLERTVVTALVALDLVPSAATSFWMSAGPPLCTSAGWE